MAQRELPNGLGTAFRLALQYWFSLTEQERRRSTMGPPEAALLRLRQLEGRDVREYYAASCSVTRARKR